MPKFVICVLLLWVYTPTALHCGKVFPTRLAPTTTNSRLVVKNVSELSEFKNLVLEVDDTRRILELREGIAEAKINHIPRLTFRCICGTTYASVFGNKIKLN